MLTRSPIFAVREETEANAGDKMQSPSAEVAGPGGRKASEATGGSGGEGGKGGEGKMKLAEVAGGEGGLRIV